MRKISLKKKIVAYACAAAMVFSSFAGVSFANDTTVSAADAVEVAIGEITVAEGETATHKGWFPASEKTSSEYKYAEMTYTGTGDAFNETRFVFANAAGETLPEVWFATWQKSKFVTVDGTDVPVATAEPQTVIIDLEKSGVDVSGGFEGIHIHAGTTLTGTVNISSFKLLKEATSPTEPSIPASTIAVPELNTIEVKEGDKATYRGWFAATEKTSADYKYLQMTYTGTGDAFNETRFVFANAAGETLPEVWFATWQKSKFVTVDGTDIPVATAEPQTVVIDLEKSGVDVSGGFEGLHVHAGLELTGTVTFSDVKFQTTPEITKTEEATTPSETPSVEPSSPEVTTPADPSTGIKLDDAASGMNKTYHIDKAAAGAADGIQYKYLGFVTFKDLANKDFKYLQFTYTGDITNLRFEFNEKGTDANQGAFWFDPEQEIHFVTKDGSPIQLVGNNTTVVIDLVASGVDMSKYNNGIHMHGNSTTDAAFDVTIKDAVLFGGVPTPQETTAPQKQTTKASTVKAPSKTKVKSASKKKSAKKAKISLKKVKGAKGYYVQISKTKKFKKVLVKKYVKKAKFTIKSKKLKNKKKLYVRAKAYKLNGKKKVLSKKWSKAKKMKIKK